MSNRKQAHPVHGIAHENLYANFVKAQSGIIKPGVSWQLLIALMIITLIAAFGCVVLGAALAGLGVGS